MYVLKLKIEKRKEGRKGKIKEKMCVMLTCFLSILWGTRKPKNLFKSLKQKNLLIKQNE